ncbi:YhdP family protein [Corallincola platygyrae]|uniref:YhdP family protein n=1 Tax=Corallincola platygyrae TaxID=1193278 RepID=A0ABW4XQL3_9GAMM
MSKRFLSPLYWLKKAWLVLAIVLVLSAMAVSAVRALLPYLDDYRDEIIDWMYQEYQIELSIDTLTARWEKLGPSLALQGLSLAGSDDGLQLSVAEARVELDFWQTLLHREWRFKQLTLDGVRLSIDPTLQQASTSADGSIRTTLAELFFLHLTRFELTNSEVMLKEQDQQWRKVEIESVVWINRDGRHQGQGSVVLEPRTQQLANFILELEGELGNKESLQGQLYIDAKRVNLAPYLNRVLGDFYEVTSSEVSTEVWIDFGWEKLESILVSFGENHIGWKSGDESHTVTLSGGLASWLPTDSGGWKFATQKTQFATDGQAWKDYDVSGIIDDEKLVMSVKELDLSRVLPLLTLAPEIPPDIEDPLRGLRPRGILHDLTLYIDVKQQKLHLGTELSGLGWSAWNRIPGVSGLEGRLVIHPDSGHMSLHGRDLPVDVDDMFAEPFALARMDGVFYWLKQEGVTKLFSDHVRLATAELGVTSSFMLEFAEQTSLYLYADTSLKDASKAYRYYPLPVMDEELVLYLTESLQGGHTKSGSLLWHGSFAQYPYENNDGIFQAYVDLAEATFKFDPEWPALDPVNLMLKFENDGMEITSTSGQLMGTELSELKAVIPEFKDESTLYINAKASSDGTNATRLMQASPLADSVGEVLTDIPVTGAINANLELTIPLYEAAEVVAKGDVAFNGNTVTIDAVETPIENFVGRLSFVDSRIKIRSGRGNLYDHPVRFDLDGREVRGEDYRIDASVDGHWPMTALKALWDDPRLELAKGKTDWQGSIVVQTFGEKVRSQIDVRTSLEGIQLDLPAPFDKPSDAAWPILVSLAHDQQTLAIDVDMPERGEAKVTMTDDGELLLLDAISVAIGRAQLPTLKDGDVRVGIGLDSLDLSLWLEMASTLHPEKIEPSGFAPPDEPSRVSFSRLKANVGRLSISGLLLEQANLELNAEGDSYNGLIKGHDTDLRFTYADDSVVIDAESIRLGLRQQLPSDPDAEASTAQEQFDAFEEALAEDLDKAKTRELPAISLRCGRCGIDKYTFGEIELDIRPWEDGREGMELSQLQVKPRDGEVNVTGGWQLGEAGMESKFEGRIRSSNTGRSSQYMGLPSVVRDADMDMRFSLSWLGYPEEYRHENFNGDISMDMKNGYIVEAGGAGVGLISLLSLDSLVRRLRLDFSDMFDKGLYFNRFRGNFGIKQGVVSTDNLKMDGPSGTMDILGSTSLVDETLNYDVVFYPKLTASLPVLTAFAITPVTGLYVLALSTVLDPVVEVVYQVNLKIDGTISDPNVREVDRKSKDMKMKDLKKEDGEEAAPEAIGEPAKPVGDDSSPAEPPTVLSKPASSSGSDELGGKAIPLKMLMQEAA